MKEKKVNTDIWSDDKQKIIKQISDYVSNCKDISKAIRVLNFVKEEKVA